MALLKVVAHFKDGSLKKGTIRNFSPNNDFFHLEISIGQVDVININALKAVFFVKHFLGKRILRNSKKTDNYDLEAGTIRKVRITFSDGEEIDGFGYYSGREKLGFFIRPTNKRSNNERIFIITSAIKKVERL
jgi:hypothetical protein